MTKLNEILEEAGLKNHSLVEVFPGTLTHKTVQKARTGSRKISKKSQQKIVDALNSLLLSEKPYVKADIFPENE